MNLGTFLFIGIRKLILPFEKLEKFIPRKGKILDIGCGHGTFVVLLAKKSKAREVIGTDPSEEKIRQAKQIGIGIKNLKFYHGYLNNVRSKKFDCVVISDVLYLLPEKQKLSLLKLAKKKLSKEGVLILKEIENKDGVINKLISFEEFLMTKIFKLTYSQYRKTYFPKVTEYKSLLKKSGFKSIKTFRLKGILPYPHIVFVAK